MTHRVHCCLLILLSAFMATPVRAQRTVFAHFMLVNQNDVAVGAPAESLIASYQRQIQQAQAIGIDGFALNAGGWSKEPHYILQASEMFEAAYRLHSNFKLMFSADMCCGNTAEDVEDMVRRFSNHPRYRSICYQRNGRFLLTTFAGSKEGPAFWRSVRRDLETGAHPSKIEARDTPLAGGVASSRPVPTLLVPAFFWGGELPEKADIERGLSEYASILDGAFYWGIAGVPGLGHAPDQLPSSSAYASVLHAAGKLYMAPVCFQFWGANAGRYYEYSGYEGLRAMWMDAIQTTHPELIEIITWNDFIEGTYISPIADAASYPGANDLGASPAPASTLGYFHTHSGATDLMKYYIAWYKTGTRPVLTHNRVYWAYRTVQNMKPVGSPPLRMFGSIKNVVYITTNLTGPAKLKVSFGEESRVVTLPAGSTDVEVPTFPGQAPRFELVLKGQPSLRGQGTDTIVADGPYRNLYLSTGSMQN